nr:hypothetical protein [uncultured bacterium]
MNQLRKYYDEKGIAAMNFTCKNKGSCMRNSVNFLSPREACVGTGYDDYILPRVLFISLDAANSYPSNEPVHRTLGAMQHVHETTCVPSKIKRSPHWKWTHRFAFETLKGIAPKWGITLKYDDICKYFAHTNSAKCKFDTEAIGEGPSRVFKKCQQYIPEEVRILHPDVIFTQGAKAAESIRGMAPAYKVTNPDNPKYWYEIINMNDRKVIKFITPHSGNRKDFNEQRREGVFGWYLAEAQKFLQSWVQSDIARNEVE